MRVSQIPRALEVAPEVPKLFIGPPGVGKTQMVQQWAQRIGRKLYVIPLAHFEPEDIKGIPYVAPDGKLYIKKGPLIPDENEEAVVFFDEITCVSSQKIAIALKAVDEKQIGYFRFPKSYIVAAGNPQKWGGFELDSRMVSRFLRLDLEFDYDEDTKALLNYFMKKYPDSLAVGKVAAFLTYDKSFTLKEPKNVGDAFPNPRQWEKVINILNSGEDDISLISGAIGTGAAAQFINFLKLFENLKVVEQVLDEKEPLPEYKTDKLDIAFVITTGLAYQVKKNNPNQLLRAVKFIKHCLIKGTHVPYDLLLCFARAVLNRGIAFTQPVVQELKDVVKELMK